MKEPYNRKLSKLRWSRVMRVPPRGRTRSVRQWYAGVCRIFHDSRIGQFLSQDSVSYPICLDLYAYANGDPINYFDPDGRFASPVYQAIKATVLDVWNNPRFQGSIQAFGGLSEAGFGGGMTYATGGLAAPAGWAVMAHGFDHFDFIFY